MPAPTGAYVFRDASVIADAVEYANQLRKARLVPDQPIQVYRTLVPDGAVQDADSVVWTFEIEGLQINIAGGLAAYLRAQSGNQISLTLVPKVGSGLPKATFTGVALMPEFGGEQGAFLTQTLTLPVVGAPVFGTTP
jgi:hypothetical protein